MFSHLVARSVHLLRSDCFHGAVEILEEDTDACGKQRQIGLHMGWVSKKLLLGSKKIIIRIKRKLLLGSKKILLFVSKGKKEGGEGRKEGRKEERLK